MKKQKTLKIDNISDFVQRLLERDFYDYHDKIYDFAMEYWEEDIIDAFDSWKDKGKLDIDNDEEFFVHFLVWCIFNWEFKDNSTIFSRFFKVEADKMGPYTHKMLKQWGESYPSLAEVVESKADLGEDLFLLKDIFSDREFIVKFTEDERPEQTGNHILGFPVLVGEYYCYFGGYTELSLLYKEEVYSLLDKFKDADFTEGLIGNNDWETFLRHRFPDLLALFFFKNKEQGDRNNVVELSFMSKGQLDVLNVLREQMGKEYTDDEVNLGITVWEIFCKLIDPTIQNPAVNAAAIEYLITKKIGRKTTQKAIANKYSVNTSSLSNAFRRLETALDELQD
jgi:hypothetical protein